MRLLMAPVFDDVEEVFQAPGSTHEPVQVVADRSVDDAVAEVGQELTVCGRTTSQLMDPLAGVTLRLEGGGLVLAVEVGDGTPVQAAPVVFRVRQLSIHGGLRPNGGRRCADRALTQGPAGAVNPLCEVLQRLLPGADRHRDADAACLSVHHFGGRNAPSRICGVLKRAVSGVARSAQVNWSSAVTG